MTIMEKLTGKKVKWTHFVQQKGDFLDNRDAYVWKKRINRRIRKARKNNPFLQPMKAEIMTVPYGMNKIVIWYGTFV